MKRRVKIAPSILAADFLHLADDIRRVEAAGADCIHFDVMDGHFVPNLSMGPGILEQVRAFTKLHLDVHLMLDNPEAFIAPFVKAGADGVTVHLEVVADPDRVLAAIGDLGVARGLSINPDTPVARLAGKVANVDRLLVMSVFPGFGGQSFIPKSLERLRQARALLDREGREAAELEIDGGVGPGNAAEIVAAGADCLVAGTAVFRTPDPAGAMRIMRGG